MNLGTEKNTNYPWLKVYPAGIDWAAPLANTSLLELLAQSAERYPHRVATDFKGAKLTYRQLQKRVNKVSAGLQKLGLAKGARVGICLPNCPQFIEAYYGILKAGGVVVNLNPLYSPHELAHELKDAGVEMIFVLRMKALTDKISEAIKNVPVRYVIHTGFGEILPFPKNILFRFLKRKERSHMPDGDHFVPMARFFFGHRRFKPVDVKPDDLALLQYTGGTTGTPKAAMLTHANLSANMAQCGRWFIGMKDGEEIIMAVIPFFHSFAMTAVMNLSIAHGGTLLIHPKFDAREALEDISKKKPTLLCAVPAMYAAIAGYGKVAEYDLSSLKMGISGGAPLPLEIKRRYEELTQSKLVEGYGLTETSPVAACNPLFGTNKEGSIGLPLPRTIIEIIDKDDKQTPLPPGEIGELCIIGPQVMRGYWNKPEETENVMRGVRLHTGDLGYMDEDGYVFIVDRLKDMIISGGYNIYPRNIEEALYTHPAVAEAAVIAMEHPMRGQTPKAFVVLKPGTAATEVELKTFLREKLSSFSIPSTIEFRDALPKTPIGKIDKKQLKN